MRAACVRVSLDPSRGAAKIEDATGESAQNTTYGIAIALASCGIVSRILLAIHCSPMPTPASQREFALEIVRQLRDAGFESLWAGGCVRDELLGLEPTDYDVATSATPDQVRDLFGRRRTLSIGAAFGVISVLGSRKTGQIDVASFRTDASYSDGRHPDSIAFANAREDAARRDFTINGLFYDPIADKVIDYVDGQADLKRQLVRAIGDPSKRLDEDKLRMLRAVRFAATFGFAIEPATSAAIQAMASEVSTVSAERIGMEIRRMLAIPNRAAAIGLLKATMLLPHVFPEVSALNLAAFEATIRVLSRLTEPSLPLALAALLHRAAPRAIDKGVRAVADRSDVAVIARRLRYTNKEAERASWLLAKLPMIAQGHNLPWPGLQRVLIHQGALEAIALREAIAGIDDDGARFCRARLAEPIEMLNPVPLLTGSDLIDHGVLPGPDFAWILDQVRDAQLLGEIRSPADALALVDRLVKH